MRKTLNPSNYDPIHGSQALKRPFLNRPFNDPSSRRFALWPSKTGFRYQNFMGGRDLRQRTLSSLRRTVLKSVFTIRRPIGDFDRDYMNFMYGGGAKMNPEFPPLGPDLNRVRPQADAEKSDNQSEYRLGSRGRSRIADALRQDRSALV